MLPWVLASIHIQRIDPSVRVSDVPGRWSARALQKYLLHSSEMAGAKEQSAIRTWYTSIIRVWQTKEAGIRHRFSSTWQRKVLYSSWRCLQDHVDKRKKKYLYFLSSTDSRMHGLQILPYVAKPVIWFNPHKVMYGMCVGDGNKYLNLKFENAHSVT